MEKIAAKYAAALFEIALEQKIEERLLVETRQLEEQLSAQPAFLKLLSQSQISSAEKKSMLVEVFPSFHPFLLNLLQLLVDKRRSILMVEVMKEYRHLYNKHFNIIEAIAYTVIALTQDEIKEIEETLSLKEGAKVMLTNRLDSSLISGIKIRFEDKVIDASMKTRIKDLREHLIEGRS